MPATSNINGIRLAVPPEFDGIIPVSPCSDLFDFEKPAFEGLRALVRPGMIAYDVGMSYGVISALMAKMGAEVHAFEPNSLVLGHAKQLFAANQVTVHINNVLVGDNSGGTADFFVLPGIRSVASTCNPGILVEFPHAERRTVPVISLDDYAARSGRFPDVIKMDVEGAEYLALIGAQTTLSRGPAIVLESHGLEIIGIGGSLKECMDFLAKFEYSATDLVRNEAVALEEYARAYANQIGYCLLRREK